MKFWLFTFMLLFFSFCGYASPLTLTSDDGKDFSGLAARVIFRGIAEDTYYVGTENILDVPYEEGKLTIYISDEIIYAGHHTFPGMIVVMRPTARISGRVIDERDNLIQHVRLHTICSSLLPEPPPNETDNLGFFTIPEVGFGSCDISAVINGKLTTYNLDVNKSKHYVISIRIPTEEEASNIGIYFLVSVLVFAIVLGFILFRKKASSQEAEEPRTALAEAFSKRQEDIVATLSERERLIVTDLFYAGKLTQSQLRHRTKLPKSTLHRTLNSLEKKNILLQIEESGVKKITLTEFFLK